MTEKLEKLKQGYANLSEWLEHIMAAIVLIAIVIAICSLWAPFKEFLQTRSESGAFLKYMATEERCQTFQSYTGTPVALQYRMNVSTLSRFANEVAGSLNGTTLAVAASDQIASLTGAINLDLNSAFKTVATTGYTSELAKTTVEGLYRKQVENWNDFMKSFDE